jgi:hypothetical protein
MTSNILVHLNELKQKWKNQDFFLSKEDQERYEILLYARRERVKEFYKEGRVSKGRSKTEE